MDTFLTSTHLLMDEVTKISEEPYSLQNFLRLTILNLTSLPGDVVPEKFLIEELAGAEPKELKLSRAEMTMMDAEIADITKGKFREVTKIQVQETIEDLINKGILARIFRS